MSLNLLPWIAVIMLLVLLISLNPNLLVSTRWLPRAPAFMTLVAAFAVVQWPINVIAVLGVVVLLLEVHA